MELFTWEHVEIFAKVPYLHLYSEPGFWDEES